MKTKNEIKPLDGSDALASESQRESVDPDLLKRCRELESALHRLLTADIPRPLGGIIDEVERQAAIEWNAFERGEARQHALAILRQNESSDGS